MKLPFEITHKEEWRWLANHRLYEAKLKSAKKKDRPEIEAILQVINSKLREFAVKGVNQLEQTRIAGKAGGAAQRDTSSELANEVVKEWKRLEQAKSELRHNWPSLIAQKLRVTLPTVHAKLDQKKIRLIKRKTKT